MHGDRHAPVTVTVMSVDEKFSMSVSNKGEGVSPELIQQLFKPFRRAPSNGVHRGLGLGLYIVSEIARSHSGTMDVSSHNGTTCFTFSMPNRSVAADLALS